MGAWKLETAKARLSEVVRQAAVDGPQTITVRGAPSAVVLSQNDYQRLTGKPDGPSWVDRLLTEFAEDSEHEFVFERDRDGGRDIDF
jgi:prevent-host-death family protein